MTEAYVGIGSNVERERHLRAAVTGLRARFGPLRISPVYASPAIGYAGDEYYNLVVGFDTELEPEPLAAELDAIELANGRAADAISLAPRTLDLDLLLYGDRVLERPDLRLPRPDVTRYAFVLKPLVDLAPQLRHPLLGQSLLSLWRAFPADSHPLRQVELSLS